MEKIVDNWGVFVALLTDLSKVFDCISHDLIIAKLEAYGFRTDVLKLIHEYLSNSKELNLMMQITRGRIYFMVSHRDPYLVLYYLIYIYVTFSIFWKT